MSVPTKMISLQPLLKVQKKFEQFRAHLHTEQEQAGAIQAFEYCFELSWKMMQRIIASKAVDTPPGKKDIFRAAARLGLLENPEVWFSFLEQRNMTAHTYDEEVAEDLLAILPVFSIELALFIQKAEACLAQETLYP